MILDKPKLSDWYHKQRYKALFVYILEIIWGNRTIVNPRNLSMIFHLSGEI
jgi:hypothetical protein